MAAVELSPIRVSDKELAHDLLNGGNTSENQREAVLRIASSQPGTMVELLDAFELALRREGDIPDSQFATKVLEENLHKP